MERRKFLKASALLSAAYALPIFCTHKKIIKPNIIFILADDLGWGQLGCYGSQFYETPNLDRLAEQGQRFTNAYAAAPVCSPTRASIMTGKYPARLHITDFIKGGEPPAGSKLKHPDWTKFLPLEEITMAEVLKQSGYSTALFGKWHLSVDKTPPESLPVNPNKQGFDESFISYKPSPLLAQEWQTPENDGHNVEIITRKSLQFIDENQQQPFFLFVSHNAIHDPLMGKKAQIEKYQNKPDNQLPQNNPVIGAMLETLDKSVGRLMKKLDKLDLANNTLVIFFSDNGGLEKVADQTPLRSGKASLYEGGIRVPLIVRWRGQIKPGIVSDAIVSSIDFFPTLCELAGAQISHHVDGVNLLPVLKQTGSLQREAICWHYPHYHSAGEGPSGAIRMGDYKLLEWFEKTASSIQTEGALELYNLREDLSEQKNLIHEKPELAEQMYQRLKNWRKAVKAQEMEKTVASNNR